MESRYEKAFARLVKGALASRGVLDESVRRAAFDGDDMPDSFGDYVAKVRNHAYKITDEDVAALQAAGHSEDAIFEITIAAAVGAANLRREKALAALRGSK